MAQAYEHLQKLSAHLKGLDSGSQDAGAIDCILREVDRLRENFTLKTAAHELLDVLIDIVNLVEDRTKQDSGAYAAFVRAGALIRRVQAP